MNIFKLRKYLRLNPTGKTGKKGTYSLRLTIGTDPALTPIRKEFGLGTSDEEEALMRAALIMRVVYELGCKLSNRIKLDDVKLGELLDSLQPPQKKRADCTSELPLFEFLPPEKKKDEEP